MTEKEPIIIGRVLSSLDNESQQVIRQLDALSFAIWDNALNESKERHDRVIKIVKNALDCIKQNIDNAQVLADWSKQYSEL